jgi:hypothetical protein
MKKLFENWNRYINLNENTETPKHNMGEDINNIYFPEERWEPTDKDKRIIEQVIDLLYKKGVPEADFYDAEKLKEHFKKFTGYTDAYDEQVAQVFGTVLGGGRGHIHLLSPAGKIGTNIDLAIHIANGMKNARERSTGEPQ